MRIKNLNKRKSFMWAIALVIGFLGSLGVASCGFTGDEEDDQVATYPVELLGGWQGVTRLEVMADENGLSTPEQVTETVIEGERIAINPNGTIVGYTLAGNGDWNEKSRGFWVYTESKLLVSDYNGDIVYNVLKLDDKELTISQSVKETDDDGKEYTRTITSNYIRLTVE